MALGLRKMLVGSVGGITVASISGYGIYDRVSLERQIRKRGDELKAEEPEAPENPIAKEAADRLRESVKSQLEEVDRTLKDWKNQIKGSLDDLAEKNTDNIQRIRNIEEWMTSGASTTRPSGSPSNS